MKRKVTISLEIDPADYQNVEDSEKSVAELTKQILYGFADLPDEGCLIKCGDFELKVS